MNTYLSRSARAWLIAPDGGDPCGGPWIKHTSVSLSYRAADPWTITLIVLGEAYAFDRATIAEQLHDAPTGSDAPDVGLRIDAGAPDGVVVELRPARLAQFLASSWRAVPAGGEADAIDWDGELAQLMEVDQ